MSEAVSYPHDLDAERSVLGAILIDPPMLVTAQDAVAPSHFYRQAHRVMFEALQALAEAQQALDHVTLAGYLRDRGQLEMAGGPAYIGSLTDGVPRATNVEHYAGIVRDKAIRRELLRAAQGLLEASQSPAPVSDLIDAGIQSLVDLSGSASPGDLVAGPQLVKEAYAWLEEMAKRRADRRVAGVSSGLPGLDHMTDGFQPGELVIVAARPSQGKSAIALQFALAADGPCAFFSLEMGRDQLAARAIALLGRIDGWAMRKGTLHKDEFARMSEGMERLSESCLWIDDTPRLSVSQLRSKARRLQITHGLSMVVCDYLQLMTPADKGKDANREQQVAGLTRGLKATAKELKVPVIALAQLNRATEAGRDKEPTLANLRESGAVEQDADLVLFIHRQDAQTVAVEGDVRLLVAKNRTGPTGGVDLRWYPSQTRFGSPGGA